ncbi:MAG: DMT family transporter [Burkholderiaceae bacterium]
MRPADPVTADSAVDSTPSVSPEAAAPSAATTVVLTLLSLAAFAGNSLLARAALRDTAVDPAAFTAIRLVSGALTLWLIVRLRRKATAPEGSWRSGFALFAYAATFSLAYRTLSAGTGALLLFGAVQMSMLAIALARGERLRGRQVVGIVCAFAGLVILYLPGLSAPPLGGSLLMACAGTAWGVYSLRGKGVADPIAASAGNFLRAAPFAVALAAIMPSGFQVDAAGAVDAILSGTLTSAVGYVIWYTALRGLRATSAATVQLAVPVVAAIGGVLWLREVPEPRLAVATLAILGGIALVVLRPAGGR